MAFQGTLPFGPGDTGVVEPSLHSDPSGMMPWLRGYEWKGCTWWGRWGWWEWWEVGVMGVEGVVGVVGVGWMVRVRVEIASWSVFVCLLASGSLWATCSLEAYCSMYILLLYYFAITLYHIHVLLVSSLIMFVFLVVCRCGYPYLC